MITQIKRPTLLVADLDAALTVYRDILGLKVDAVRDKEPASSSAPRSLAYEYFGLDPDRYTFTRFATLSTSAAQRAFGLIKFFRASGDPPSSSFSSSRDRPEGVVSGATKSIPTTTPHVFSKNETRLIIGTRNRISRFLGTLAFL